MGVKHVRGVKRAVLRLMRTIELSLMRNSIVNYDKRCMPRPDRCAYFLSQLEKELGPYNTGLPSTRQLDRLAENAIITRSRCTDPIEVASLSALAHVFKVLAREASYMRAYVKISRAHGAMLAEYKEWLGDRGWMDRFYRRRISELEELRELVR